MNNPLVSAVITTHNRIDLLKKAIESVLAQTYTNMECIVVSDNSTDGTNEFCSQHKEILLISIPAEKSHGGNYARNLGIKAAKGEYVAFLDDDDQWLPTKVEKQVALMIESHCGLVYCGKEMFYVNKPDKTKISLPSPMLCGDMKRKILYRMCTITSCMMVKRECLFQVGLYDENLSFWQEYELTIRLAQITDFYYVKEPLVIYRIDTADKKRLTNKYDAWRKSVKYIYSKHHCLFDQLGFLEKEKARLFYTADAMNRAHNAGLVFTENIHKIKLVTRFLPSRILIWIQNKLH